MSSVLAVDLGGTKCALALIDSEGGIEDYRKVSASHSLDKTVELVASAVAAASAVCVIVPGIFDALSGNAWCPNLWGMDEVPLLDRLRRSIRVPVHVDSDRSGYVLGEAWVGVARGMKNVVFVSVGTGIGIGILSDGRVVRGAHGIAGAAGWWSLTPEWKDVYARAGCWESEAAGPAVARAAGAPDAESVVHAARSGDANALRAITHAAEFTGRGIANLISVFNPEMVVLGGGFVQGAGDLLIDNVRRTALRWAQPVAARRCRIELTTLGNQAGLYGAARLALEGL